MPPPNITGKLHMGHALFLTLQDSLTRFYKITGNTALWQPGLDHAGLATHEKILAHQALTNQSYEQSAKYIESHHKSIILSQIQAMGALPDWDLLTYTLDEDYTQLANSALALLCQKRKIFFKDGQHYIDFAQEAANLKKDIESGLINIIPGKETAELFNFLDNWQPWCISRQIPWGLSLNINEQSEYTPDQCYKNSSLDTWFNSSLWPIACLMKNPELFEEFYPAALIETGADILFFWCAKMLMMGAFLYEHQHELGLNLKTKYPFYTIYLHGLIRDKQNRKFSKSLGNGIDPLDMLEKYGPDALRLFLCTRTGPAEDMKFNEQDLPGFKKFMNKIWQSARFFSIYLAQHELEKMPDSFMPMDCTALADFQIQYIDQMQNFDFLNASRATQRFFKEWFCDQWIESHKKQIQEGCPNTIYSGLWILEQLLAMLHPFCPFITSEIKQQLY